MTILGNTKLDNAKEGVNTMTGALGGSKSFTVSD